MLIKFVTGNKHKLNEIADFFGPIEIQQVNIDLVEVQSLNAREIIGHKLAEARKQISGAIIVEDTSLYLECFGYKLPGPFIKWFLESIGPQGIANMVQKMGLSKAYAVTLFGYSSSQGKIDFFEGRAEGKIVNPIGDKDFGWGPIFLPDGQTKTYGQMERQEKYALSMRAIAAKKLKEFLS